MFSRPFISAFLGLAVVGASALGMGACKCTSDDFPAESPLVVPLHDEGTFGAVPDYYFVILQDDASEALMARTAENIVSRGGTIRETYNNYLRGFAAVLPPETLKAVRRDKYVKYIEVINELRPANLQTCCSWALEAISTGNQAGAWRGINVWDYTGEGIDIISLDTGVDASHPEFGDRIKDGWSLKYDQGQLTPTTAGKADSKQDCWGHGTMMLSLVLGATTGIAKKANGIPIKLTKECPKIATDMDPKPTQGQPTEAEMKAAIEGMIISKPDATVLLIGWEWSGVATTVRGAIQKRITDGFKGVIVAPAGNGAPSTGPEITCEFVDPALNNNNPIKPSDVVPAALEHNQKSDDITNKVPLSEWPFIVVGAVNERLERAAFSNYGQCISLFAPGENVIAALPSQAGDIYYNPIDAAFMIRTSGLYGYASGTSVSAALAAGVLAQIMQMRMEKNLVLDGFEVEKDLLALADPNRVISSEPKNTQAPGPMITYPLLRSPLKSEKFVTVAISTMEGTQTSDEDGMNDGLSKCDDAHCEHNLCDMLLSYDSYQPKARCDGGLACGEGVLCERLHENKMGDAANGNMTPEKLDQWSCERCGSAGKKCCGNDGDPAQNRCGKDSLCVEGLCVCGGKGQPCCENFGCMDDLTCDSTDPSAPAPTCQKILEIPLGDLKLFPLSGWGFTFDDEFNCNIVKVTLSITISELPGPGNHVKVTATVKMSDSGLCGDVTGGETTQEMIVDLPNGDIIPSLPFSLELEYIDDPPPNESNFYDDVFAMAGKSPNELVLTAKCVAISADHQWANGDDVCGWDEMPYCSGCTIHLGSIRVRLP